MGRHNEVVSDALNKAILYIRNTTKSTVGGEKNESFNKRKICIKTYDRFGSE